MLKIRLMRIGTKKIPFYRVVVVDERAKRTGAYIELVGTYNPLTQPKDIKLKQKRIDYWIKQGAQPSVGFLRIIGKAPQRLPRKPKKEKTESSAVSPQLSDQKNEEAERQASETPKEIPSETPTDEKSVEESPNQEEISESTLAEQPKTEEKSDS